MYVPVGDGSSPSTEQTQLITSATLDRHMPKSARVLAALKRDGWTETRRRGSHRVLVKDDRQRQRLVATASPQWPPERSLWTWKSLIADMVFADGVW